MRKTKALTVMPNQKRAGFSSLPIRPSRVTHLLRRSETIRIIAIEIEAITKTS
jgi:hypothetical protein